MFIIPRLPKTQEEEYKDYPWRRLYVFQHIREPTLRFFLPSTLQAPNNEYIIAARLQASKSRQNK